MIDLRIPAGVQNGHPMFTFPEPDDDLWLEGEVLYLAVGDRVLIDRREEAP